MKRRSCSPQLSPLTRDTDVIDDEFRRRRRRAAADGGDDFTGPPVKRRALPRHLAEEQELDRSESTRETCSESTRKPWSEKEAPCREQQDKTEPCRSTQSGKTQSDRTRPKRTCVANAAVTKSQTDSAQSCRNQHRKTEPSKGDEPCKVEPCETGTRTPGRGDQPRPCHSPTSQHKPYQQHTYRRPTNPDTPGEVKSSHSYPATGCPSTPTTATTSTAAAPCTVRTTTSRVVFSGTVVSAPARSPTLLDLVARAAAAAAAAKQKTQPTSGHEGGGRPKEARGDHIKPSSCSSCPSPPHLTITNPRSLSACQQDSEGILSTPPKAPSPESHSGPSGSSPSPRPSTSQSPLPKDKVQTCAEDLRQKSPAKQQQTRMQSDSAQLHPVQKRCHPLHHSQGLLTQQGKSAQQRNLSTHQGKLPAHQGSLSTHQEKLSTQGTSPNPQGNLSTPQGNLPKEYCSQQQRASPQPGVSTHDRDCKVQQGQKGQQGQGVPQRDGPVPGEAGPSGTGAGCKAQVKGPIQVQNPVCFNRWFQNLQRFVLAAASLQQQGGGGGKVTVRTPPRPTGPSPQGLVNNSVRVGTTVRDLLDKQRGGSEPAPKGQPLHIQGNRILVPGTKLVGRNSVVPGVRPPATVVRTVTSQAGGAGKSVIDLTDDDDRNKAAEGKGRGGAQLAVRAPGAGSQGTGPGRPGTVLVQQMPTSGGPVIVQQVVSQPVRTAQGTTYVYTSTRPGSLAIQTAPGTSLVRPALVTATAPPTLRPANQVVTLTRGPASAVRPPPPLRSAPGTMITSVVSSQGKHPAPLPPQPDLQPLIGAKQPPPKPGLKISRVQSGIVLSWNMTVTDVIAHISSYQLFAYQETSVPPSTALWKKVGDVKALPLPMACTLTQFQEGNKYHFAVRAVDVHSRVGPFSDPSSIALTVINVS